VGTRTGLAGRRGAGAFMNRQWFIAALVVSAALAFAGSSEASSAVSSPPAPRRAAASPRHSVAGASATATHAARSHHARKHHRHHTADRTQLTARNPMGGAGGSPSQPAHHMPHHHAALRPSSHSRPQARNRTGSHGQQAVSPGSIGISTATARLDLCSLRSPASHIEMVSRGRGPPRAGPLYDASSPSSQAVLGSTTFPTHHPLTIAVDVSRDRLMSRPHPVRLEGAAVCSDCPP
jgi:hypothetical protein